MHKRYCDLVFISALVYFIHCLTDANGPCMFLTPSPQSHARRFSLRMMALNMKNYHDTAPVCLEVNVWKCFVIYQSVSILKNQKRIYSNFLIWFHINKWRTKPGMNFSILKLFFQFRFWQTCMCVLVYCNEKRFPWMRCAKLLLDVVYIHYKADRSVMILSHTEWAFCELRLKKVEVFVNACTAVWVCHRRRNTAVETCKEFWDRNIRIDNS